VFWRGFPRSLKTRGMTLAEMIIAMGVSSLVLLASNMTFLNSSAAILTYKSTQDAICGGQQVPATVWSSSAYVLRGGKWLAASHQETPAK